MEEDDELVPQPDERGYLSITNRAWVNIDPIIWTMSLKLVKLDMSYNHIVEIPSQVGEMIMLRELIASFNRISHIPPEIGKLKRLKRLVLNSNRLRAIPIEIGQLEVLEELSLSENSIEELPRTVSKMANLRILRLGNNKLLSIPFEIADILTLEEFNCANNPNLEMVPAKWRGDTESVLFTCRVHRDYDVRMAEMVQTNTELSKHSQITEQENLVMKEKVSILLGQIDELKKNIPKKVARRMEREAERAQEQELGGEGSRGGSNCCGIKCVIC